LLWQGGPLCQLTEISGLVKLFGREPLHGFPDERIEPLAAFAQMMDDFLSSERGRR